jgi:hypothetical protein
VRPHPAATSAADHPSCVPPRPASGIVHKAGCTRESRDDCDGDAHVSARGADRPRCGCGCGGGWAAAVGDRAARCVRCRPCRGHALELGVAADVECAGGVLGVGEGDGAGQDGVGLQGDAVPINIHPHTSDALCPVQAHKVIRVIHIKCPCECALQVLDAAQIADARAGQELQAVPIRRVLPSDGLQLKPAPCNLSAVGTAGNIEVVDGGALAQPQQLRVRADVIVAYSAGNLPPVVCEVSSRGGTAVDGRREGVRTSEGKVTGKTIVYYTLDYSRMNAP